MPSQLPKKGWDEGWDRWDALAPCRRLKDIDPASVRVVCVDIWSSAVWASPHPFLSKPSRVITSCRRFAVVGFCLSPSIFRNCQSLSISTCPRWSLRAVSMRSSQGSTTVRCACDPAAWPTVRATVRAAHPASRSALPPPTIDLDREQAHRYQSHRRLLARSADCPSGPAGSGVRSSSAMTMNWRGRSVVIRS